MKISEVIEKFEKIKSQYGDLEICFDDSYWQKIKRLSSIEVWKRDVNEFPDTVKWVEDNIVIVDFFTSITEPVNDNN